MDNGILLLLFLDLSFGLFALPDCVVVLLHPLKGTFTSLRASVFGALVGLLFQLLCRIRLVQLESDSAVPQLLSQSLGLLLRPSIARRLLIESRVDRTEIFQSLESLAPRDIP